MKRVIIVILFYSATLPIFAQLQNIEYGLGIMYNFQSNGIGIDGRGEIPVTKKISITPRIAYFPGFNTIHEAYAGLDGDYHFLILKSYKFYGIIGAYYNGWLNYDKFDESIAKKNNFTFETGVGAEFTKKCVSPFFETRISSKWKEAFFIFGIKFCRSNCKGTYRTIKCPDF